MGRNLIDVQPCHSWKFRCQQLHFCTSSAAAEKYIDNLIINQFSPFQVDLVFDKDIMKVHASYRIEILPSIASRDIDREQAMVRGVFDFLISLFCGTVPPRNVINSYVDRNSLKNELLQACPVRYTYSYLSRITQLRLTSRVVYPFSYPYPIPVKNGRVSGIYPIPDTRLMAPIGYLKIPDTRPLLVVVRVWICVGIYSEFWLFYTRFQTYPYPIPVKSGRISGIYPIPIPV